MKNSDIFVGLMIFCDKKYLIFKEIFLLIALFFVGCAKHELTWQEKQDLVKSSRDFHTDLLNKYYKELKSLNSDKKNDEIKKDKIIEIAGSKRYKESFWDKVYPELAPKNIPLHKYIEGLNIELDFLNSKYRALIRIRDFESSVPIATHVQNLINDLLEIRAFITTCKEYREEGRYINIMSRRV
ncbi:MAG: hypothetical protein V1646_04630 [bacterium]